MAVVGLIKKGAYFDSVTLMTVGNALAAMDGVVDAAVVMGTRENKAILSTSGLLTPEFEAARDTDLLIGITADSDEAAERALAATDGLLADTRSTDDIGGNAVARVSPALPLSPRIQLIESGVTKTTSAKIHRFSQPI